MLPTELWWQRKSSFDNVLDLDSNISIKNQNIYLVGIEVLQILKSEAILQ